MADPSKTIAMAMLVRTIDQTVLPATVQNPDPSCNMRVNILIESETVKGSPTLLPGSGKGEHHEHYPRNR